MEKFDIICIALAIIIFLIACWIKCSNVWKKKQVEPFNVYTSGAKNRGRMMISDTTQGNNRSMFERFRPQPLGKLRDSPRRYPSAILPIKSNQWEHTSKKIRDHDSRLKTLL